MLSDRLIYVACFATFGRDARITAGLFWALDKYRRVSGDQKTGGGGRLLERGAYDLSRIDYTGLDQIHILFCLSIKTESR